MITVTLKAIFPNGQSRTHQIKVARGPNAAGRAINKAAKMFSYGREVQIRLA